MTNVSSSNLQTELASIMELLAKTAISEIIKLFDVRYTALRLEVIRKDDENEELKRKLLEVQEELTCVRMRFEIDNAGADHTSYPRAQEARTVPHSFDSPFSSEHQQAMREAPRRLQIKEEGPADVRWMQQAEPVRTDTADAEGLQVNQQHPQQPMEFRQLLLNLKQEELKEEQEEEQEEVRMRQEEAEMAAGGAVRGEGHTQTQVGTQDWSAPQQWNLFAHEESNADEDFLPLLPRIEQAIGYFHSNPISPESQPPPDLSLSPPAGPGPSVEAVGVYLGADAAVASPQGRRAGRQPIVCLVCHKQLQSEVELVKHMRSHPGKRPYACGICGMHLAQKSSLRCPHCSKDYTLGHHLKRHMRTHLRDHATAAPASASAGHTHAHTHTHVHIRPRGDTHTSPPAANMTYQAHTLPAHTLPAHTSDLLNISEF